MYIYCVCACVCVCAHAYLPGGLAVGSDVTSVAGVGPKVV